MRAHPELIAALTFAVAIAVGTLLLCLPMASAAGGWTDPVTAFFTAVSATCVTGLVVVDTGSYFSHAGQFVILGLIQLGGLGIMTFATTLLVLAGRRLSLRDEFVLMDALGNVQFRGIRSLLRRTIAFVATFELVGAAIVAVRLATAYDYGWPRAIYHGLFHSISAFCNAGFALHGDSLSRFRGDPVISLTIVALLVAGGLGFIVLFNLSLLRLWRRDRLARGRLSLHSSLALSASLVLMAIGWFGVLFLEWRGVLSELGLGEKLLVSLFQGTTPRTAGFNVVDMAALAPATQFLTSILMFIGGCPSSTAGGIKVTTMVVLLCATHDLVRGRARTDIWQRTIPAGLVREAIAIVLLGSFCVMLAYGVLLVTEHVGLADQQTPISSEALLFEVISAFGTVGLSTGITASLSTVGKLLLACCMFIGRLGPLTLAVSMSVGVRPKAVIYPEEDVIVG
jgi:trk system potassium uptake protein TrkH